MSQCECVVCGAEIVFKEAVVRGELVGCPDCGTDLEVKSIDPLEMIEAPTEEEDWGQ